MDTKIRKFLLYRFQLIPDANRFQQDMLEGINDLEDLKKNKTKFMRNALNALQSETESHKIRFIKEHESPDGTQYLFHLQAQRKKKVEQDFQNKIVRHQPSIWMAIDTEKETQAIAVEQKRDFSALDHTPVNEFKRQLQRLLKERSLIIRINPIQNPSTFWRFVNAHKEQISEVQFTVSAPNMSELSSKIGEGMSSLLSSTNSSTGDIALKAPQKGTLILDEGNGSLQRLVSHVDEGGGDYKFRLRGSAKKSSPVGGQETITAPLKARTDGEFEDFETGNSSILTKLRTFFRLSKK